MSNMHKFLVTLKVDDRVIATRELTVDQYNESIVNSLRLNTLMKDMVDLISASLKEKDIDRIWAQKNRYES